LPLPPAYAVVDLLAYWRFARTGRLSAGIFNLLDEKYGQWADVPVRDIHTADSIGDSDSLYQARAQLLPEPQLSILNHV
jgi:hemoglobin/transferrin/lactoferrin receptor protein